MPLLPFQFPFAKLDLTVHPTRESKKRNKNKKRKKAHLTQVYDLRQFFRYYIPLDLELYYTYSWIISALHYSSDIVLFPPEGIRGDRFPFWTYAFFYFPLFTPLASIPWSLDIIPGLTSIGAQPSGINCPFEEAEFCQLALRVRWKAETVAMLLLICHHIGRISCVSGDILVFGVTGWCCWRFHHRPLSWKEEKKNTPEQR